MITQDISNNFSYKQGDPPRMINGMEFTDYTCGENAGCNLDGIFYPINLTVEMLRKPNPGYGSSQPIEIKIALGVPITERLTWGMVDAYQELSNTINIPYEQTKNIGDMPDTAVLMELAKDPVAFNAWQEENRKKTVGFVKQAVKNKNQKISETSGAESLKNASVNTSDFNAYIYYSNNPDLQAAIGADATALYEHWITYGKSEGRIAK